MVVKYCSTVFVIYYMVQYFTQICKESKMNIFIHASFYYEKMIKVTKWTVQDRSLD